MPSDNPKSVDVLTQKICQQGSAEQLVRENAGWMLVLAKRMLNDSALAEDVVQEALINAPRVCRASRRKPA